MYLTGTTSVHLGPCKVTPMLKLSNLRGGGGGGGLISVIITRAYVKRRGPRRKGVKYGCNSL